MMIRCQYCNTHLAVDEYEVTIEICWKCGNPWKKVTKKKIAPEDTKIYKAVIINNNIPTSKI